MDYIRDIKPLEDAGKTDAEIATLLSAKTVTDMPNLLLRKYLHRNNLWLTDPATGLRLAGAIGEAYAALSVPNKALVRKLQAWVYDQDSIETENNLEVAAEFKTIIDGLVNLSIITSTDRANIGSLAGGLRFGAQTATDVSDVRDANDAAVAEEVRQDSLLSLQAEIENTWINPAVSDGTSDALSVRAAIKAGL